jgi:hypothetical protein
VYATLCGRYESDDSRRLMDSNSNDRDFSFEFHLAEYARLTNEINQRIESSGKTETTLAYGIAAYLGWYFSQSRYFMVHPDVALLAKIVLPMLVAVALVRAAYNYIKIWDTAGYLKLIEQNYAKTRIYKNIHLKDTAEPIGKKAPKLYVSEVANSEATPPPLYGWENWCNDRANRKGIRGNQRYLASIRQNLAFVVYQSFVWSVMIAVSLAPLLETLFPIAPSIRSIVDTLK